MRILSIAGCNTNMDTNLLVVPSAGYIAGSFAGCFLNNSGIGSFAGCHLSYCGINDGCSGLTLFLVDYKMITLFAGNTTGIRKILPPSPAIQPAKGHEYIFSGCIQFIFICRLFPPIIIHLPAIQPAKA